jgi:hypothetical protein
MYVRTSPRTAVRFRSETGRPHDGIGKAFLPPGIIDPLGMVPTDS